MEISEDLPVFTLIGEGLPVFTLLDLYAAAMQQSCAVG